LGVGGKVKGKGRKKKKKAWGKHQRIDIRRSIRKGGLLVIKTGTLQSLLDIAVFYFEPMQ
jgi:hypothetical protein